MKKNLFATIVILAGFIFSAHAQEIDPRFSEIFSQEEIKAMGEKQINEYNCFFGMGFYVIPDLPKGTKVVNINTITEKKNTSVTLSADKVINIKLFNPLLYNFEKYFDPLNVPEGKQIYFSLGGSYGYLVFRPKSEWDGQCKLDF